VTITGRYRTSGSDNTTARYFQSSVGLNQNAGASNQAQTVQSSFALGSQGDAGLPMFSMVVDFLRPAQNAIPKNVAGSLQFFDAGGNLYIGRAFAGTHDNTNTPFVVDSFSVISSAASSMTGVVRVYGYANS
jgi:hypothetical protein